MSERLLREFEVDEAVEGFYRRGEDLERAGDLRSAAQCFRVVADHGLGDASVRLASLLFALGETAEAQRWHEVAVADGFDSSLVRTDVAVRQEFLEHAARITVGAPTFDWVPSSVPVGSLEVGDVRTRTAALRALDQRYGGIVCHASVVEHLARVEPFIVVGDAAIWTAVAEVHELAGWTAFDSGMPGVALPHFSRALTLARQAENESLIASVLTRAGRMFLHHNAPDDALRAFQLGFVAAHNSWADQRSLSDPSAAIASLTTKVGTYDSSHVRAQVLALTALARNHLALGDPGAALSFAAEAAAVSGNLRSARADDQLRWLAAEARAAGASVLVEQISARFARSG
jgi:tetratricopeptide (TPR) repeat protein